MALVVKQDAGSGQNHGFSSRLQCASNGASDFLAESNTLRRWSWHENSHVRSVLQAAWDAAKKKAKVGRESELGILRDVGHYCQRGMR